MSEWVAPQAQDIVMRMHINYLDILSEKGDIGGSVFAWAMYVTNVGDVLRVLTDAQTQYQSLEVIRPQLVQTLAQLYMSVNALIYMEETSTFEAVFEYYKPQEPEELPIKNIVDLLIYDLELVVQNIKQPVTERFLDSVNLFQYSLNITLQELDEATR